MVLNLFHYVILAVVNKNIPNFKETLLNLEQKFIDMYPFEYNMAPIRWFFIRFKTHMRIKRKMKFIKYGKK